MTELLFALLKINFTNTDCEIFSEIILPLTIYLTKSLRLLTGDTVHNLHRNLNSKTKRSGNELCLESITKKKSGKQIQRNIFFQNEKIKIKWIYWCKNRNKIQISEMKH